jgi:hypothetical protein
MTTPQIVARALASDPGPTFSAFARLDAYDNGVIAVRGAWYMTHNARWLTNQLLELQMAAAGGPALFGVETIAGAIYKGRGTHQLFATKDVEGAIKEVARSRNVTPIEITAPHWREVLIGSKGPSDAMIGCAIERLFRNVATGALELPVMSATEREHCYDAIGVGFVLLAEHLQYPCKLLPEQMALWLRNHLRFPGGILPDAIRAEVAKVAMQGKAAKQARDFAKANGIKLPSKRRKPTRAVAQNARMQAAATRTMNRVIRGR